MRTAILIPFLTALLALPAAAQQQPSRYEEPVPPQVIERFSGPISFKSKERLVQGRAVMRQWHIANDETAEIPHQGLLIVHLPAGALVTEIGGERKERSEDSFWSVLPGQRLIVHTARDSVVLQTVELITK